jgi:surface polysaccharide O-acyltransferase-like enzyme
LWKSTRALIAGFVAIVILSVATDYLLQTLKVFPASGPMPDPRLNALALCYRILYGIVGGYITARLAPEKPMQHALFLGLIGLLLSTAGAIFTVPMHLGPAWYPISLAVTAVPCAWIGGLLHRRSQS